MANAITLAYTLRNLIAKDGAMRVEPAAPRLKPSGGPEARALDDHSPHHTRKRVMGKINRLLVGEALVGEGNEIAHIDLILGPRGGPAETAFANALVNNKDGFTTLLAVVAPNLLVKPPTILFNKVTIKNGKQATQLFGPAQRGVALAVADSVEDGTIPVDEAENTFISVGVFIHWLAEDDAKIQDYNYEATRIALQRAVAGEPAAAEVVSRKLSVDHPFQAHK